jgi:hypothetical protein
MRRARACIWAYTVLPATRTLYPIREESSPKTTQSSPAFTHCIPAAPQFTYPEGMEGRVNLSTPGTEPGAPVVDLHDSIRSEQRIFHEVLRRLIFISIVTPP